MANKSSKKEKTELRQLLMRDGITRASTSATRLDRKASMAAAIALRKNELRKTTRSIA